MKTVKVTPDNIISVIDVNFDDFRDLQKAVGGHFARYDNFLLFLICPAFCLKYQKITYGRVPDY